MFALVRSLGGWFLGSVILPAEIAALDERGPHTIEDGGGTWAFTTPAILGGGAITLNPTTLTLSATAMAVSAPGTWTAAQTINAGMTWGAAGTIVTNAATVTTLAGPITSSGANTWTGAQTYGAAATVVLTPTRTFTRPVNTMMFLLGTSTMDAVRLPLPTSGLGAAQRIDSVPHGATITKIKVQVDPANDGGLLAATPSAVSLGRRAATGAGSAITTGIGGSTADTGATDVEHTIEHTLSQVIDLDAYEYFVCLSAEDGANKQIIEMLSSRIEFTLGTVPFA